MYCYLIFVFDYDEFLLQISEYMIILGMKVKPNTETQIAQATTATTETEPLTLSEFRVSLIDIMELDEN